MTTAMATTLRCRQWPRCTTEPLRSTSTASVCGSVSIDIADENLGLGAATWAYISGIEKAFASFVLFLSPMLHQCYNTVPLIVVITHAARCFT